MPDQISKLWDIIKYAIEQSVPPSTGDHPDKMNRILSAAISGKIEVWASYNKKDGQNKFEGLVITEFMYDDASGVKNLLLYVIYGYDQVAKSSWINGTMILAKYAKATGCTNIVAYTRNEGFVKLANRLCGDTSYTYVSINVNEIVQKLNGLDIGETDGIKW